MSTLKNRIIDRAMTGMARTEIAAELGCPASTVYSTIGYARREGIYVPRKARAGAGTLDPRVTVSRTILVALEPHAKARDMPVRELAAALLAEVVRGDLVDAVMDDGGNDA